MLTISQLAISPDLIIFEDILLKIYNLLLLLLKMMSNSKSYFSQTLTRMDNTSLQGANRMMSSA